MKKGFTLIELIGVIVIVALITLLAIPAILNTMNSNKKSISNLTKDTIYSATDLYISDNSKSFPKYEGSIYCVTIGTLVNEGRLTKDIYANAIDEGLDSTKTVKITVKNNVFEKEIVNVNECNRHIVISISKNENKKISSYLAEEEASCVSSVDGEVINVEELSVGNHVITCNINGINTSFEAIVTDNSN